MNHNLMVLFVTVKVARCSFQMFKNPLGLLGGNDYDYKSVFLEGQIFGGHEDDDARSRSEGKNFPNKPLIL